MGPVSLAADVDTGSRRAVFSVPNTVLAVCAPRIPSPVVNAVFFLSARGSDILSLFPADH